MDQEKRVLLAIAISFLMIVLWQKLFVKGPPRPGSQAGGTLPRTAPPAKAQAPAARGTGRAKAAAPAPLPVQQGAKAEEIVIEGELYRVMLSTQGAVVKSWVLKKYSDQKGEPLDVVDRAACEQLGYPMTLSLADAQLSTKLTTALYVAKPSGASLQVPATVEFVYSDGSVRATKRFTFGQHYEASVEAGVFDGAHFLPLGLSWPGGFGDHSLSPAEKDSMTRVVYGKPEDINRVPQGKVKDDRAIPAPLTLMGLEDRYFADVFLADSQDVSFRIARRAWNPPEWKEKEPPKPLEVTLWGADPEKPIRLRMLVAPKDLDVLRAASPPLDGLVDFGWFSVVARPLFVALRYIYDHWAHNYGWAIIILTVAINLAMFPLKLKGLRSAQEMQKIAPIVKGIQDRYKQYKFNDPRKQRMNQEIMKLYQEHGVNPVSGCLPMLLQMPFLYAFYNVLTVAIELRHAPWMGWVKDLSGPDTFYILPIVMTVTMFILQKMTPVATADPAQQRMMMFMPLIFGFMFLKFASGLVLYWLTGNLVGIGQQVFINRMMPATQAVKPAGKPVSVKE